MPRIGTRRMNWLLISCIASFALALILGLVLIAFWLADRADDRDEQLIAEIQAMRGDPCPWPIKGGR